MFEIHADAKEVDLFVGRNKNARLQKYLDIPNRNLFKFAIINQLEFSVNIFFGFPRFQATTSSRSWQPRANNVNNPIPAESRTTKGIQAAGIEHRTAPGCNINPRKLSMKSKNPKRCGSQLLALHY